MNPGTSFRNKIGNVKLAVNFSELVKDRAVAFGLPSLAVGSILAATVKVISDQRENAKQRKEQSSTKEMGGRAIELRMKGDELTGEDKKIAAAGNWLMTGKSKAGSDERNKEEDGEDKKQKGLDGKACWEGYRLEGTKMKGGRRVDNCVKVAAAGNWPMTGRPKGDNIFTDLPVSLLAMTVPGVLSYKLLMKKFREEERDQVEREIQQLKARHLDFVAGTNESKTASLLPLDSLVDAASDAITGLPKVASTKAVKEFFSNPGEGLHTLSSAGVGTMASLSLLAGITTHINRLRKERALDRMYEDEAKRMSGPMSAVSVEREYY